MAQFCFTLAASFFVSILTTKIESQKTFMVFIVVVVVGFILALFFTTRWIRSRGSLQGTIKKIKSLQIGPVGEQGKEIRMSDLAQLPAQQAEEKGAE
jgi:Na+/melibiose symporter-like transporter